MRKDPEIAIGRTSVVIFIGWLAMAAGAAVAAPLVIAQDGTAIDDAVAVQADNGASWVRVGLGAPLEVTPDDRGNLRLPQLLTARYIVLDAVSGQPVKSGSLRWQIAGAPKELKRASWRSAAGHLDLPCRGDERMVVAAPGYAPTAVVVTADGRRQAVSLRPQAKLTVALEPSTEASMWLAREDRVTVTNLFKNEAEEHEIGAEGVLEVRRLDQGAPYIGIVVAPGHAPIVVSVQDLPKDLELPLEEGLGITGTVRDHEGNPLAGARLEAIGVITELDSFRYRHYATSTADGSFSLKGFLPGTVRVRACAKRFACSEAKIEMAADTAADAVKLDLAPGRDILLKVENQIGDPIADATVYYEDLVHVTDAKGELRIEGITRGTTIPVKIFGPGFGVWEGSFATDRDRVVITVPGGGIIEQQVLANRRFAAEDVVVRWQGYHPNGREGKSGEGEWDAELGIARATGLEAGTYALTVRLPGSATLTSERVDVAPGDQVVLAPVVPDRGLAIAGRVLDAETLQPIAGALVSCEPGSPSVFRAPHAVENAPGTSTDTEGVFLLEGLDPGACRAVVSAAGYAAWRLDGVEPDDLGFDIGDVEMDKGMTIVGRVFDRNDRPITGATVEIAEDALYAYFAETTVRTNHDGYFRAERLPVGRWALTARLGQETAREKVSGSARETVEVDLMLGGIRIEGEVWLGDSRAQGGTLVLTTEGSQAQGVVVMMERVTADRQIFGIDQQPMQFMVSPDGRFAGTGLVPGRFYASYTPVEAGAAPVTKILDVPRVETFQCAIQYADAAVEGYVVDTDGVPVAGASVMASAGDGIQDATAFTDAEGRFSVRGLEPGRLVLTANHTEFAPSEPTELELRDGYAEGPVVLELLPHEGAAILLTVNTLAGSAGGAPVYLVGPQTETGFTDGGGRLLPPLRLCLRRCDRVRPQSRGR